MFTVVILISCYEAVAYNLEFLNFLGKSLWFFIHYNVRCYTMN